MFYTFYLSSNIPFDELKRIISESISNDEIIENSEKRYEISSDGFNLRTREGSDGVKFRSEDYGINFRFEFWFDIYSYHTDWARELMGFIGRIMHRLDGDCLLESNGEIPILLKRDNVVIVDDKKLAGIEKFPFHALNLDYKEEDIKINR
ncbi:SitI3 family protein [Paenibacillus sp. LHD-117]|uniref:SitI3 family protein n=1 Tax=Paenibacillus sp. LHD-117 TaxID=3071412 RepID=UPI0027E1F4EA|nr:SitI3 family protein [Paenibacillus sp. LHD-117]MDQ6419788.1 SitI3 family protein [Paenibacillus sp. LHD-117]